MGSAHEYRLGNIFLRNFYTALDFDKDLIMIGVNRGSASLASATIIGHKQNPFHQKSSRTTVGYGFLALGFIVLVCIALGYFIIEKRNLQRASAGGDTQTIEHQVAPTIEEDKDSQEDDEEEDDNIIEKSNNDYAIQGESMEESMNTSADKNEE